MDGIVQDSDESFQLGEMFDSYEELEKKLEKFSKRRLVHYWRRDSRTVSGAHMKTARPISEKLKYYSVKYACIYGGQKFLPRGAGRRQSQSIRTNCPAHIMLRASKDGTKLEVTSFNNDHNHEISEELFKKLPQERKLCGEIKQEVQDLMQLHIDRKRLKEYVRLRTNKILRSKDLFNIAAAYKQKRDITPERAYQLFKRMNELESAQAQEAGKRPYMESEDDIAQRLKRLKKGHSPWGPDGLSTDLEISEGNDGEDSYSAHMTHEEVTDDMDATEGQLLSPNAEGNLIAAGGEIVGELVMDDGDPSVIVESIVNADGSVFVDERDFNNYCHNRLGHSNASPGSQESQVLDIETISDPIEISKIAHNSASTTTRLLSDPLSPAGSKSPTMDESQDTKIWIMESTDLEPDMDTCPESIDKNGKSMSDSNAEVADVEAFAKEANHQLLLEQLAVLRAEKEKLYHETDMLKLKKDKLKLQINCYTAEIKKQEMEKEKLRLEIKLLQSKVVEDSNDVSHYIFVP